MTARIQRVASAARRALRPLVGALALVTVVGCTAIGEDATGRDETSRLALSTAYSAVVSNGTLQITDTSGGATRLTLRLASGAPTILEVDVGDDGAADFTFDRNAFDHIVVQAGSGDDVLRIDESNGVFTDVEATTLDGGKGNDTLIGGSGAETLIGGPGADTFDPGRGNDVVLMGDGNDTYTWEPGDGSDVVEGQGGTDQIVFHGANVAENIDLSANGSRLRLARNVGNVVLDANGVERVALELQGGADNVFVNDLTGTGVTRVDADLGAAGAADGSIDSVFLGGTAGADTITISAVGDQVVAKGLAAQVRITGYEADDRFVVDGVGQDVVNVNGSDGADTMNVAYASGYARVTATGFSASVDVIGAASLVVHGLGGPDTITGGNGLSSVGIPIVLDGGGGDDTLSGNVGQLLGGVGNDTFVWNPGLGSSVIEGQGGRDVLVFHGANVSEIVDLSANGGRLRLTRNVANVTLDVNGVEQVEVDALGGADSVLVSDLTGTSVKVVTVDLASTLGVGDGAADTVVVDATTGADKIAISEDAGAVVVGGLAAQVRIAHAEPTFDRLVVDANGGGDTIKLEAGVETLIGLTLDP